MSTGPSNRCKSGCYGAESSTERTLGAHGISYILREDTWGNGYATEAATHVVDFAFTTTGVERLEAMHAPTIRPPACPRSSPCSTSSKPRGPLGKTYRTP
ncbi:GNAT family N-acetyltransferase [Streptomyces sp. ISID311]|uniref:GNAT family N-acetyltransferase n=1 Tax=Streptomyces sp. ISID311 TaxID=2601673 RepID=UPI0021C29E51|nr:GNAT family N-acetyltransferase [Streptomyces sp. ISID311]